MLIRILLVRQFAVRKLPNPQLNIAYYRLWAIFSLSCYKLWLGLGSAYGWEQGYGQDYHVNSAKNK